MGLQNSSDEEQQSSIAIEKENTLRTMTEQNSFRQVPRTDASSSPAVTAVFDTSPPTAASATEKAKEVSKAPLLAPILIGPSIRFLEELHNRLTSTQSSGTATDEEIESFNQFRQNIVDSVEEHHHALTDEERSILYAEQSSDETSHQEPEKPVN